MILHLVANGEQISPVTANRSTTSLARGPLTRGGSVATESSRWLFTEELAPSSFEDLQRDGTAVEDGVHNPLALRNLRKLRKGDRALDYHTATGKAVGGSVRVVRAARLAPGEDGEAVIEVQAVRKLPFPLSLTRLETDSTLAEWELVRLPRLSILPVSEAPWQRVEEWSGEPREQRVPTWAPDRAGV
jgi:predicted RNA-binding protein with PUA-like domain